MLYEIIGYVGSALIVVSLAMSNIIRLRVVNLVGALVFMTYGVLIGSLPVTATNLIISGIGTAESDVVAYRAAE